MLTINTIIKELKDVPVDRLEDLYAVIYSLQATTQKPNSNRKRILSFAGSFADMTQENYEDFIKKTQDIRKNLFDRDINL